MEELKKEMDVIQTGGGPEKEQPAFECRKLTMRYGKTLALDAVDLTLMPGRIVGLLGPNGSGKTTMIKLANGLLQPTSGEILIAGNAPGPKSKSLVAYLPDRDFLPPYMNVTQLLDFYSDFFVDFDRERAEKLLESLGFDPKQKLKAMSKGTKEKIQLVLTMSRRAKIYLLDEPIAGVDPAARDFIIRTIIGNYAEDALVVISTHLIADIETVLDEVVFLKKGHIVLHKQSDEVIAENGKDIDHVFREVIKEVGMVMMPLYAAMLVLAAAAGLSMRFSIMKGTRDFVASTVPGVVTLILMLVYGALILAMAVMTLVMTTRNFRDNLLGSRGYLMNTLPVTTQSQVLSKSLNGLIWIALGGVASAVSGTIALLFVMRRQDWTEFFRTINEMFGDRMSPWVMLLQLVILFVLGALQIVTKIFVSISVGNLWRSKRGLGAVLMFVGLTVLQTLISNRLTHLVPDASISYSLMGNGISMVFGMNSGDAGLFTARQMGFAAGQDILYIVLFLIGTIWVLRNKMDLQ